MFYKEQQENKNRLKPYMQAPKASFLLGDSSGKKKKTETITRIDYSPQRKNNPFKIQSYKLAETNLTDSVFYPGCKQKFLILVHNSAKKKYE